MAKNTTITLITSEANNAFTLMRVDTGIEGDSDTFILTDEDLDDLQAQITALVKQKVTELVQNNPLTFNNTKWTSAF